jgi:hypothetical protein
MFSLILFSRNTDQLLYITGIIHITMKEEDKREGSGKDDFFILDLQWLIDMVWYVMYQAEVVSHLSRY